MKIIALYGKPNTGKTTTLNLVVKSLKQDSSELEKPEIGVLDNRYYLKLSDGRTVCITTAGDDWETQNDNLNYVKERNPDIWITASHTKDDSTAPVLEPVRNGAIGYVTWIRKLFPVTIMHSNSAYRYETDQPSVFLDSICNRMNQIDADRILNMIYYDKN